MKVQSRLGVTIPQQNESCCCAAQISKLTEIANSDAQLWTFAHCDGFSIEWQIWDFLNSEWDTAQVGGETYDWLDDGEIVRVKMSKEGCCDYYTYADLFTE